jgi:hypothetical protein
MKKGAPKRLQRTRATKKTKPDIVVPPSPYDFEETVRRVLKVKPPAKKRAGG